MGYRNLNQCIDDLERTGQLVRIEEEIDPNLEAAEIQRRVYAAQGPAIYFARVKGCRFPIVSNLFGTMERTRFLFRDSLQAVRHLVELKIDPFQFWRHPFRYRDVLKTLWSMRASKVSSGPILKNQTTIDQLPQVTNWPDDAGAFITLGQVYSEDADRSGFRNSNLGMYRIQMSGGQYAPNKQVGLHYQIHRSIGIHHASHIRRGVPFRVSIFVGGPPAMMLAAVMPLPEGLSELMFAGALGRRRVKMICRPDQPPIFAEADFCITGAVDPDKVLPEGPFGDHLGYYSLAHDFPVLNVERVYHRDGAIWPFTVVGRPPQEDTSFGKIIHEITGPIIPTVVAGVHAVHAVDATGVHPLLLAIGSERYVPYAEQRKPQEILTCANAILGQGQLSLAKYLLIVTYEDNPDLDIENIPDFFGHVLQRVDWRTDLHFQTQTTIDTLDYSGHGFNEGSKVVVATAGPPRRELPTELPGELNLPTGFSHPRVALPGIIVVQAPQFSEALPLDGGGLGTGDPHSGADPAIEQFCRQFRREHSINAFPLIVLVDDSEFAARTLNNFLWVTFTRSNPAADIYGIDSFVRRKHWGCRGSLVIDARIKSHHAPPLVEDPEVSKRVDQLAAPGGPLHGIL